MIFIVLAFILRVCLTFNTNTKNNNRKVNFVSTFIFTRINASYTVSIRLKKNSLFWWRTLCKKREIEWRQKKRKQNPQKKVIDCLSGFSFKDAFIYLIDHYIYIYIFLVNSLFIHQYTCMLAETYIVYDAHSSSFQRQTKHWFVMAFLSSVYYFRFNYGPLLVDVQHYFFSEINKKNLWYIEYKTSLWVFSLETFFPDPVIDTVSLEILPINIVVHKKGRHQIY